ncbi:MAG: hypothetical protein Q8Q08_01870 [Candidatus Omnitrophota bacterium]|nr:hypothetical protein [Candidatus Omnitrophota bacterium]MDZ4241231.1 hypothetical protein [Candidatus Omnitrophota bacterium]
MRKAVLLLIFLVVLGIYVLSTVQPTLFLRFTKKCIPAEYYPDGKVKEEACLDEKGKFQVQRTYYANGNVWVERFYEGRGFVASSTKVYDLNGGWTESKGDGKIRAFDPSGKLLHTIGVSSKY